MENRVAKAWSKWRELSGVICDKKIPTKLKILIYQTVIRPTLLYGCETWPMAVKDERRMAARVVTRSSKYSSITPTLKKLHWLPVKYRIIFKVVLLTFKALHGSAPNYLRTLLQSYIPSRSLRSETGNLLIMPKARRKLGCQSFAVAAPKLWNDLPVNIRTTTSIVSFRSSLKTHLFKLAYA